MTYFWGSERRSSGKKIRVGIIGTRGVPNHYGGFERFVELLVDNDIWGSNSFEFYIYSEWQDTPFNSVSSVRSVGLSKDKRPFMYYLKSALLASRECDVVFCCGIGLSLFSFLPRFFGVPLIVNPDGCEWNRRKWSYLGRLILRLFWIPVKVSADHLVIDAEELRVDFGLTRKRNVTYVGYQAPDPVRDVSRSADTRFGKYFLVIARLEPENNIKLILDAFLSAGLKDVNLVIIGSKTTVFFDRVLRNYTSDNINFLGSIYDQEALNDIRRGCIGYVHGHSVGGTNPSLLEAISSVPSCLICHDNKFNREVASDVSYFFDSETRLIELFLHVASQFPRRLPSRDPRFHPDHIAEVYLEIFRKVYVTR